jgi:hypothetical protein
VPLGAVVRHEQDDGVVEVAARFQVLDEFADLRIEIRDHRRIDLHPARFAVAIVGIHLRPWGLGG